MTASGMCCPLPRCSSMSMARSPPGQYWVEGKVVYAQRFAERKSLCSVRKTYFKDQEHDCRFRVNQAFFIGDNVRMVETGMMVTGETEETTIENRCQARRFGQSRSRTSNSREVSSDRLQETSDWRPATQTAKRERNVRRNTHPTRSLPADRFQNNRYSIHSLHEQHVLQFLQQFVREFVDFVKDGAKYTNPPAETAGAERCNCAFSHRLRKKKGGHRLYRKRCHRDSSCERKTKTRCLQQCHFVRNGSCRRQKTTSYALPTCCAATTCVETPAVDVAFSFGCLRAVVF